MPSPTDTSKSHNVIVEKKGQDSVVPSSKIHPAPKIKETLKEVLQAKLESLKRKADVQSKTREEHGVPEKLKKVSRGIPKEYPQYIMHVIDTSPTKKLLIQLRTIFKDDMPAKLIGAILELDGSLAIQGDGTKYGEILKIMRRQIKSANPTLKGYRYTNLILSKHIP